ncbi:MAG: helix-turn-helix transcriptional regulator [Clostridia bacterium]|nr:helix-turn-helix transcriptional regulator [Clostridia bacterium]
MKHSLWKSRTFRFWIVCYLIVLLIPLAFSGVLQAHTSKNLRARAYEDGSHSVDLLARVTDERLSALFNMANTVCGASDIIKLRFIQLPFDAAKYYEIHKRAEFLSNFSAYVDMVSGCYVYCDNLGCILDAHHIYTRDNQYSRVVTQQFGLEEDAFEALMGARHTGDFCLTGSGRLLLIKSVSSGMKFSRPPLTVILVLDTARTRALFDLTGKNWQGRALMLLPESALASGEGDGEWLSSEARLMPDGDSVVVAQQSAVMEGVRYALVIPQSRLLADAKSSLLLFLWFTLCTLALGGALALLLAHHNYKPVRELSRTIEANEEGGGAFSAISRRFGELREELARLSVIENRQIFEALLSGKLYRLEPEQLKQLRGTIGGDLFIAVLLEPEREGGAAPDDEAFAAQLEAQLVSRSGNVCHCVVRPYDSGYAAVLGFAEGVSRYDAQLCAQDLVKDVISRDTAFPALSAYLGNACEGLEGVSQSCRQAAMAREYANFVSRTGRQVVLFDETMVSSDISWRDYDIVDAERRFVALMLDGSYGASEQLLHEIISYYTGQEGVSLRVMQTRMYGVINMMLNVLHEAEPHAGDTLQGKGGLLERLLNARTMQELEDVVFQILRQLQDQHDQTQDQLSAKLEAVTHYISANYYDQNLSVQMLADRFGLSLPYLSREFKNSKGIGVLNYINQYRIDKAKEILLHDEDATLADVAQRVGYSSSQTLIRIFKRYEGVTPGQFREAGKNAHGA